MQSLFSPSLFPIFIPLYFFLSLCWKNLYSLSFLFIPIFISSHLYFSFLFPTIFILPPSFRLPSLSFFFPRSEAEATTTMPHRDGTWPPALLPSHFLPLEEEESAFSSFDQTPSSAAFLASRRKIFLPKASAKAGTFSPVFVVTWSSSAEEVVSFCSRWRTFSRRKLGRFFPSMGRGYEGLFRIFG